MLRPFAIAGAWHGHVSTVIGGRHRNPLATLLRQSVKQYRGREGFPCCSSAIVASIASPYSVLLPTLGVAFYQQPDPAHCVTGCTAERREQQLGTECCLTPGG